MAPNPNIATDWKVVVNNIDLSEWAFDVQGADEKPAVDASGFSHTRRKTKLPGLRDQTVTVQFRSDWQSGGPNQTIKALYSSGTVFDFYVQPDGDLGTSDANPLYGGTANVFSFPFAATLEQVEDLTIAFSPAPGNLFEWGTVAP